MASPPEEESLDDAPRDGTSPGKIWDELEALYAELAQRIEQAGPVCRARGLCCDFRQADHRLFATELEVDYARRAGLQFRGEDPALCPYFEDNLCHAREARPLGCRLYFCEAGWEETMERLSDEFHSRIRDLHKRHRLAYRYAPFVERIRSQA